MPFAKGSNHIAGPSHIHGKLDCSSTIGDNCIVSEGGEFLDTSGNLSIDRGEILGTRIFGCNYGKVGEAPTNAPHESPLGTVAQPGAAKDRDQPTRGTVRPHADELAQGVERPFEADG